MTLKFWRKKNNKLGLMSDLSNDLVGNDELKACASG